VLVAAAVLVLVCFGAAGGAPGLTCRSLRHDELATQAESNRIADCAHACPTAA
jgi:hypothetical protein